jgi:hypothetical protein
MVPLAARLFSLDEPENALPFEIQVQQQWWKGPAIMHVR